MLVRRAESDCHLEVDVRCTEQCVYEEEQREKSATHVTHSTANKVIESDDGQS